MHDEIHVDDAQLLARVSRHPNCRVYQTIIQERTHQAGASDLSLDLTCHVSGVRDVDSVYNHFDVYAHICNGQSRGQIIVGNQSSLSAY